MIYQTDENLPKHMRDDECYEFSILDIHEDFGNHEFTIAQLINIHRVVTNANFMGKDGFINYRGMQGIANVASAISGINVDIRLVSVNDNFNALIARFSLRDGDKLYTHFPRLSMEDYKSVIYDPYSPYGSRTVREGKITGYRYIRAEVL